MLWINTSSAGFASPTTVLCGGPKTPNPRRVTPLPPCKAMKSINCLNACPGWESTWKSRPRACPPKGVTSASHCPRAQDRPHLSATKSQIPRKAGGCLCLARWQCFVHLHPHPTEIPWSPPLTHLFIHRYSLSMYYVPGALLGARNTVGSKTEPDSHPLERTVQQG